MRSSSLAISGLALSTTAAAQVVQWDIAKRHDLPSLRRRAGNSQLIDIQNEKTNGGYFASVKIGSNSQKLTLQLDTGSSDIWVPYAGSSACTETSANNPGCTQGSFNPDSSNSYVTVGKDLFLAQYVDNSFAKGDYFQDKFVIGGATVQNMTMGLGLQTDIDFGLIGVGYMLDEGLTATAEEIYPNLPIAMQEAGLINTVAYSLWLNDLDASTGNILFGGIDTAKYTGDLIKVPVLRDQQINNYTAFMVSLSSVEASSSSGNDVVASGVSVSTVLDSGTTLSYLPQDMAEVIWNEVGASYDAEFQIAMLPCAFGSNDGSFTFQFGGSGGPRINVTMAELVVDLTNGQEPQFTSGPYAGQTACEFGIQNTTSAPYLLGDTFLRSAYVVYDLVNNEIGLAATDFNTTSSNVVAFASEGAAIPSATAASSQSGSSTTTPSPSGSLNAAHGFQSGSSSSSSSSSDSDGDSAAGSLTVLSLSGVVTVGATIGFALFQSLA